MASNITDNNESDGNLSPAGTQSPNGEAKGEPDGGSANPNQGQTGFSLSLAIPDRDMGPSETAVLLRDVSKALSYFLGHALSFYSNNNCVGPAHPVYQKVFGAAANLEAAAIELDQANRLLSMPQGPHPNFMGRA